MKISKIVKSAIICSLGIILPVLGITLANVSADSDAENEKIPVLTIEAEQGSLSGGASVSGKKVGNLGKCGGTTDRTVTFKNLSIPSDGEYMLKVYYMSGSCALHH